jgi:hypothetical protein
VGALHELSSFFSEDAQPGAAEERPGPLVSAHRRENAPDANERKVRAILAVSLDISVNQNSRSQHFAFSSLLSDP